MDKAGWIILAMATAVLWIAMSGVLDGIRAALDGYQWVPVAGIPVYYLWQGWRELRAERLAERRERWRP